ncbi:MAG TPA: CusA/CzcA family heavy metal efflux RND transporter, partial [Candidatus Limnocylindria bacterium]|nr:CusA/CzcA family heavy metal efflux RND transporter [Candidatus Limnocylindria bacterium]
MIRKLVHFALHQPLFLTLLVLTFIGAGIAAFLGLPIEAFPDVSDIQVQVITLYPGRAPEEVEKQVTIPVEVALSGVPHSVRMFSHTQFGLSFVVLTFDDKANDDFARRQVMERLLSADLPAGIQPSLAPLSTPIGELYRFRVTGAGHDSKELRTLEDWVIERQIKTVPGVADVVSFGGLVKQYEVQPDLARLKAYNISLQQLVGALGRGNANAGGSYTEQGAQQYLIRGVGLLRGPEDIQRTVIGAHLGTPVRVQDVATVVVSAIPRQGIAGQDDDDDIVSGIILMRKGENPTEVLGRVKERIAELNDRILPKGVKLVPYYDREWLIHTTLTTVFHNLEEGALLVAFVLLVFLGNLRAALIVALVIPLSLLATFLGLSWKGIPANLLSLGAVDFGIIVDGAVIVVENVFRHLAEGHHDFRKDPVRFRHAILNATAEVGRPTFFSMLIIIAAHLPIFTLQRHEGRIFAPMAWTVTSALIGSLLLSLSLVPLLCCVLLRKKIPHQDNWIVRGTKRLYEPVLNWALRKGRWVLAGAVMALVGTLLLFTRLGTEFLPELDEGTLWVSVTLPPGISISESTILCRKIRQTLHTVPEVATVISKAGRPEDGTDPKSLNQTESFVGLKPASEWRPGFTKAQVVDQLQRVIEEHFPGVDVGISQPIRDNVLESISQIKGQVVIKVFGDNTTEILKLAREVKQRVSSVPGVADAFIDRDGEVPQIIVEVDRDGAARYGINIQDVQDVIETALGGKSATEMWEGEKHFGVVVRLPDANRHLDQLKNILVDTPEGAKVSLSQLASFKTVSGPVNISREAGKQVKAVGVFIKGRDMGSVVSDMQVAVRGMKLGEGYYMTWSGEFENQQRAMKRLAVVLPVSVFIIFVLLFNTFRSVTSALLILLNVPFAVIGGVLALWFTGIPLSVSAAIGFIALFGQAVLNGVVMVSYFNQLVEEGKSAMDAVRIGAIVRLRTVLMTAMLAMLGLLPMALSHGIGSETQRPLAVVIIGGLVSATPLTLLVLPIVYLLFNR